MFDPSTGIGDTVLFHMPLNNRERTATTTFGEQWVILQALEGSARAGMVLIGPKELDDSARWRNCRWVFPRQLSTF